MTSPLGTMFTTIQKCPRIPSPTTYTLLDSSFRSVVRLRSTPWIHLVLVPCTLCWLINSPFGLGGHGQMIVENLSLLPLSQTYLPVKPSCRLTPPWDTPIFFLPFLIGCVSPVLRALAQASTHKRVDRKQPSPPFPSAPTTHFGKASLWRSLPRNSCFCHQPTVLSLTVIFLLRHSKPWLASAFGFDTISRPPTFPSVCFTRQIMPSFAQSGPLVKFSVGPTRSNSRPSGH